MKGILGQSYKDKITGFTGVVTGYVEYISGCNQVLLSHKVTDDGTVKAEWFDVQRVQQVDSERIVLENKETPGHDAPAPIR